MALPPGTRLGPYEVTAQIGVGGMGEVYRATDTNLKRAVAIKVLQPQSLATRNDSRGSSARPKCSPCSIIQTSRNPRPGKSDGTIALVMEFVAGPTLADRIARGPIPVDDALPIAKQIAEALEAAHERGIVHRDLKPANIKVRPDGTVRCSTLGWQKHSTHRTSRTFPGTFPGQRGTPLMVFQ